MRVLVNTFVLSLVFLFGTSSGNLAVQSFVQLSSNPDLEPVPYCEHTDWVSCNQVDVNVTALRSNQSLILPHGAMVRPLESSPGTESGSTTVVYQSEDLMNSMTITFSISGSSEVNGIIHENEKVFSLAACDQTGGDCHVLAEENVDHLIEGETASNVTMRDLDLMTKLTLEGLTDLEEDRQEQGRFQQDANGNYVATIKIYYTREFARAEPNVRAYISNMISQANAGFSNSQIRLRLRLLCTEQLNSINENLSSDGILTQFINIKGSRANLRGTADFAHLLMSQTGGDTCGIAYVGSTRLPFGVSRLGCAVSGFTFGHEIGHNLGCFHDRANSGSSHPYAFGYLIPNTRFRTKLAYRGPNNPIRINYYSNPNLRIQNVPMGNAENNCARRIQENARAFASIGSDTNSCGSSVLSTCSSSSINRFILTGSRVVVQYPLYGTYKNNEECKWLLWTVRGRRLRIFIDNLDIEDQSQCNYDVLVIFGTTSGNLGFCGSFSGYTYISSGNSIGLKFTSDSSIVDSGFRVFIDGLY